MIKHFLYSSLAALAFSFAVDATAQTAYVGLASTPSSSSNLGNEGRIVSFVRKRTLFHEKSNLFITGDRAIGPLNTVKGERNGKKKQSFLT